MVTHIEFLVEHFLDWLRVCEHDESDQLPNDGNLVELVATWMQEGGAAKAVTHESLLRAVVVLTAQAASGRIIYTLPDHEVPVVAKGPEDPRAWWPLEHAEFEAARAMCP